MEYFKNYVSNTTAASANQLFFKPTDPQTAMVGRVYYRIFAGGEYRYSFLFSNILDSTFDNGDISKCNRVIDAWDLLGVRVAVTDTAEPSHLSSEALQPLTFGGAPGVHVAPAAFFESDPILLSPKAGEYVCLEYTYRGKEIPYHEVRIIPAFVWEGEKWVDSAHVPFVGMLGCDRPVQKRIVFWGDSITEGIGTACNSYDHWNARLAEMLGTENAYWNLGIGFGRASDAASLGAWYYKAKHADLAVVCFGVNDLWQTGDAEAIKRNLSEIVDALNAAQVKVILQTVPPFDYTGDLIEKWKSVNAYIKTVLAPRVEAVFDNGSVLGKSAEEPHRARFGGHPDAEGCCRWAEALYPLVKDVLDRI